MHKLALFVLLGIIPTIFAVSSGFIPSAACLVDLPWGCPLDKYINNDRLNCSVAMQRGNLMPWATEPITTPNITLSAEIEGVPVTKYVSGARVLDIRIKSLALDPNFGLWRGIMLYAVMNNGSKVGTWKTSTGFPYLNNNICGNRVLFHNRADEKHLSEVVHYITPAAGTGTITFYALFKSGPANTGAFYWPVPLTLTEFGTEPPRANSTIRWVQSAVNQSCSAACTAQKFNGTAMTCDSRYFELFSTADDLPKSLQKFNFICNVPRVLSCTLPGPTVGAGDSCTYTSPAQCSQFGKSAATPSCTTALPTTQRYCPCNTASGLAAPVETPALFVPPADPVVTGTGNTEASPASALQSSKLLLALASFVALFGSRKQTAFLALILAFAFAVPVQGHNWLNMPARSFGQAEQIAPCPPRTQLDPHVQIRLGNNFQVEWVTGHDRFTYWVLVKSEDEAKLKTVTEANLNEYLNTAPASTDGAFGQNGTIANVAYNKYHRHAFNTTDNANTRSGTFTNFYNRVLSFTEPLYIPRPTNDIGGFLSPRNYANGSIPFQVEYRANNISRDRRAEYTNPKFPFIISVAKFEHVTDQPGQPDVALLRIPTTFPAGLYVAQWRWSGYYDCVDIDAKPAGAQVPHLLTHGVVPPNANSSFMKIDHGLVKPIWIRSLGDFTKPAGKFGCMLIRPGSEDADLAACKNLCNIGNIGRNGGTACGGIQVVPLTLPSAVPAPFSMNDVPIPFGFVSPLDTVNKTNECPQSIIAGAAPGTRICYPIVPFSITQAKTAAPMITQTNDPQNPFFYSTFFLRRTERVFAVGNALDFVRPLPDWRLGDFCGVCTERSNGNLDNKVSPIYSLAPICRNCDDTFWGGI